MSNDTLEKLRSNGSESQDESAGAVALNKSMELDAQVSGVIEYDKEGRMKPSNSKALWNLARIYASSSAVPDHYRTVVRKKFGDKWKTVEQPEAVFNCYIALETAMRLKVVPSLMLQESYVVGGKIAMQAKFLIGLLNVAVNADGKPVIKGNVQYNMVKSGEEPTSWECNAYVIDGESGKVVEGTIVDWAMVRKEGWDQPKGTQKSKWMTLPEQMFKYRAASMLINSDYPHVKLGIQTVEELEDTLNTSVAPLEAMMPEVAQVESDTESKVSKPDLKVHDEDSADQDRVIEEAIPRLEGVFSKLRSINGVKKKLKELSAEAESFLKPCIETIASNRIEEIRAKSENADKKVQTESDKPEVPVEEESQSAARDDEDEPSGSDSVVAESKEEAPTEAGFDANELKSEMEKALDGLTDYEEIEKVGNEFFAKVGDDAQLKDIIWDAIEMAQDKL